MATSCDIEITVTLDDLAITAECGDEVEILLEQEIVVEVEAFDYPPEIDLLNERVVAVEEVAENASILAQAAGEAASAAVQAVGELDNRVSSVEEVVSNLSIPTKASDLVIDESFTPENEEVQAGITILKAIERLQGHQNADLKNVVDYTVPEGGADSITITANSDLTPFSHQDIDIIITYPPFAPGGSLLRLQVNEVVAVNSYRYATNLNDNIPITAGAGEGIAHYSLRGYKNTIHITGLANRNTIGTTWSSTIVYGHIAFGLTSAPITQIRIYQVNGDAIPEGTIIQIKKVK